MGAEIESRRFINLIRGFAILLMLWGHCIQYCTNNQFDFFENNGFKFIYSFHMPLFMMISGYLFFFSSQKRSLAELIEHKTKSMLYPILMGSACNILLTDGINIFITGGGYRNLVEGISLNSLWFLWSVLSASIVFSFVIKISKKLAVEAMIFVFSIGLIVIFPGLLFNIYLYPYFVIGYLIARNDNVYKRIEKYISIVSIITFIVMFPFFEKEHYIYTSGLLGGGTIIESIRIDMFRWAIGLFGSLSMISILKLLYELLKNSKIQRIFYQMEKVGEESLGVYVLSVSLLSYWLPIISSFVLFHCSWIEWNSIIHIYNFLITPVIAVIYAVFIVRLIRILRRFGIYKIIFGR